MGWIYLARDRNLSGRWVVLKGLLNSGDAHAVAAAIAERRFLAEVDHPQIVNVYNFVTHAGAGYLVMEYVGGTSLKQMLSQRNTRAGRIDPLPVDQALAYMLEVLPALSYLHDCGLLYCDFKPDNVICQGESVKLIDLGGVRRADDTHSTLFGTRGFQAPEVPVEGPSVAADVFTIGRTLATLVLDFKANTTTYATTLPPVADTPVFARYDSFYRLLARACAFDRDDRFATIDELRVQMLGVLREVVATDHGLGAPPRTTDASKLFASPAVDVADRPLLPTEMPTLRPDEHDPLFGWLAGVTVNEPAARFGMLATPPQPTAEVLVARVQVAIAAITTEELARAAWSARARQGIEMLLELDPWDWRAAWLSGLLALTEAAATPSDLVNRSARVASAAVAARASFNAVYGQVPGELAPKLALATACELSDEPAVAESLYLVCASVDAAYTSLAAFGLARIRQQRGDAAGAMAALDLVGPTRGSYRQARAMHAQLAASSVGPWPSMPVAGTSPAPGVTARIAPPEPGRAVLPDVRLLGGVVQYWTRPVASSDEVAVVVQKLAVGGTDLVTLSGIDWQVIQVEPGRGALLLADRVIGAGPYHGYQCHITWEQCDLRRWLNDDFLMSLGAAVVDRVSVAAVRNGPALIGTDGGPDTHDRVFVLSVPEAEYLAQDGNHNTRTLGSTRLVTKDEADETAWWWLRSPGQNLDCAAYVRPDGFLSSIGNSVTTPGGVRPAFWLTL